MRQALARAGRSDRVVSSFDDLSFGPINPPDAEFRTSWVQEELGCADWDDVVAGSIPLWNEALSRGRKIAWMSRRTAQEFAGFLEWVWHLGDEPCEVVDLTDVTVIGHGHPAKPPRLAISLALLSPTQILDNGLIDRAAPLASADRKRYQDIWRQLRAENAPFRVLTADGLVSAPISFFDPLVLACATTRWQKAARIVGEALVNDMEDSLLQTGDLVLAARVRALVDTGHLEAQGDLFDIQRSEVRLPSQKS